MQIERFQPDHLRRLLLQPSQAFLGESMSDPAYGEMLAQSTSFSAIDGDQVVGCAGIIPMWEGRSVAWALLSADIGPRMVKIHRAAVRLLAFQTCRRIEATCDVRFEPARRWLEMLGFQLEGRLRAYTPTGDDHDLYARVR